MIIIISTKLGQNCDQSYFHHHSHCDGDQFYDANDESALPKVGTTAEEAGHLAHDARWVIRSLKIRSRAGTLIRFQNSSMKVSKYLLL